MVYNMKPDLVDLCTFGVLCAMVKLKDKLKKLDDWVTLCVFIGYKYSGGGYRLWDPQKSVVVECRDVTFFEDGLPTLTLSKLTMQTEATLPLDILRLWRQTSCSTPWIL